MRLGLGLRLGLGVGFRISVRVKARFSILINKSSKLVGRST